MELQQGKTNIYEKESQSLNAQTIFIADIACAVWRFLRFKNLFEHYLCNQRLLAIKLSTNEILRQQS